MDLLVVTVHKLKVKAVAGFLKLFWTEKMENTGNSQTSLKTFNLYKYLKEQNSHSMSFPYFLATQDTYKEATVRFPFRTFTYGIGINYSGDSNLFKIGSKDFEATKS